MVGAVDSQHGAKVSGRVSGWGGVYRIGRLGKTCSALIKSSKINTHSIKGVMYCKQLQEEKMCESYYSRNLFTLPPLYLTRPFQCFVCLARSGTHISLGANLKTGAKMAGNNTGFKTSILLGCKRGLLCTAKKLMQELEEEVE